MRCYKCGKEIAIDADFCGYCGSVQVTEIRHCANCGALLRIQYPQCLICGKPVPHESPWAQKVTKVLQRAHKRVFGS